MPDPDKVRLTRAAFVFCCLLYTLTSQTAAAQTYEVTDLGTLGGQRSQAFGLNNFGQVVGCSETPSGELQAFLYTRGWLLNLGTLGGGSSCAYAISNSGIAVGFSQTASGRHHPVLFGIGSPLFDLSSLGYPLDDSFSTASGINNSGQVVGYYLTVTAADEHNSSRNRAFLYSNHRISDLGTFGGAEGAATAINNSGQVVGYFSIESNPVYAAHRAFLFSAGTVVELGTLGGIRTTPADINDSGQVVGSAELPNGEPHAFLYSNGSLLDLGTLPGGRQSRAYGINNSGQVVGASDSAAGRLHAFCYSAGVMHDLNRLIPADSGWVLAKASDINDAGQIAGNGIINGQEHAFLLTPVSPIPTSNKIAEPNLKQRVQHRGPAGPRHKPRE